MYKEGEDDGEYLWRKYIIFIRWIRKKVVMESYTNVFVGKYKALMESYHFIGFSINVAESVKIWKYKFGQTS